MMCLPLAEIGHHSSVQSTFQVPTCRMLAQWIASPVDLFGSVSENWIEAHIG
jgi:hypothetical protein